MLELLPNHTQYPALEQALNAVNQTLGTKARIAAGSFERAIQEAAQQHKDQFGKYLNEGLANTNTLTSAFPNPVAIKMHSWLMAAAGHASKTGQLHLQRTTEQQQQYMQGRAAGGLVSTSPKPPSDTPPTPEPQPSAPPAPQGPSVAEITGGIASILNPLATAGAGIFQAQQQAKLAKAASRGQGSGPGFMPMYIPPPKSNTGLIIGIVGGVAALLVIVVMLSK
jgi:hypothetical protein